MTLIEKAALWANAGVNAAPHSSFHGSPGGYGMGALAAHSPAYKPPIVSPTPGIPATSAGVAQVAQQQAAQHGIAPPKMAHCEGGAMSTEPVKPPKIKPFRLQGQEAWDSLKKSEAWLSLTPFAQGFFSRCFEDGLPTSQIQAGIRKSANIDPDIYAELQQGFEKLAWPGPGLPSNVTAAIGRMGGVGRAVPQLASRAVPGGVQALGALPLSSTPRSLPMAAAASAKVPLLNAGPSFGGHVPLTPSPGVQALGAMPSTGSIPSMAPAASAAAATAPAVAPSMWSRGMGMGRTAVNTGARMGVGAGLGAGLGAGAQFGYQHQQGDASGGWAAPAAGALAGAALGARGGAGFNMLNSRLGRGISAAGAATVPFTAGVTLAGNKAQSDLSGMLTTAAQKHGVQPQSLLAMVQDPANFQKLPQSEQQAFMNSMQQHIPQMNPMHGLNEMMNGIPGLGQWDMWKNMHPGGKLMALAGLLTAGGGMMGGSPGMAGAGGLAMLAPFLFHHFMNGGGGGAPEGGAEAPPAAPGAQPGAWAAGGGPAPQFPQPTGF